MQRRHLLLAYFLYYFLTDDIFKKINAMEKLNNLRNSYDICVIVTISSKTLKDAFVC